MPRESAMGALVCEAEPLSVLRSVMVDSPMGALSPRQPARLPRRNKPGCFLFGHNLKKQAANDESSQRPGHGDTPNPAPDPRFPRWNFPSHRTRLGHLPWLLFPSERSGEREFAMTLLKIV